MHILSKFPAQHKHCGRGRKIAVTFGFGTDNSWHPKVVDKQLWNWVNPQWLSVAVSHNFSPWKHTKISKHIPKSNMNKHLQSCDVPMFIACVSNPLKCFDLVVTQLAPCRNRRQAPSNWRNSCRTDSISYRAQLYQRPFFLVKQEWILTWNKRKMHKHILFVAKRPIW